MPGPVWLLDLQVKEEYESHSLSTLSIHPRPAPAITMYTQHTKSTASEYTQAKEAFYSGQRSGIELRGFTSLTGSQSGAGPWSSVTESLGSAGFSRLWFWWVLVFSQSAFCGCCDASGSGICWGFTLSASGFCVGLVVCCWVVLLLSRFWFCWRDSR